jgi:23S rRNA pseudouridine2457 synthase
MQLRIMRYYFNCCHGLPSAAGKNTGDFHTTTLNFPRMSLILFNKPFGVLCQFSPGTANHANAINAQRLTLADFIDIPQVYPAGRLDADSEGLLLLTDEGALQHSISHPDHKQAKTYLVQVEGVPTSQQLEDLRQPLKLSDFTTQGCEVKHIHPPEWLWQRDPPVRTRQSIPTSWLCLTLREGKNRQVRRMTAAVGLPTLHLVRSAIADFSLATHPLLPGEWMKVAALKTR